MIDLAFSIINQKECGPLEIFVYAIENNSDPSKLGKELSKSVLQQAKTLNREQKNAIDFLLSSDSAYRKGITISLQPSQNSFFIHSKDILTGLKQLLSAGKFYFNNKQLICDVFGKHELIAIIEKDEKGNTYASATITGGREEIPLHECQLIGQGNSYWFIKGIVFKLLKTDIPWKYVKKLHKKPLWSDDEELRTYLQEHPDIVLDKAQALFTPSLLQPSDPLPVFILSDRSGAFGNLYLDYGEEEYIPYHDPLKQLRKGGKRQVTIEKDWERDLLETDYIKKQVGSTSYHCPIDKVTKSILFLLEIGWKVIDWQGRHIINAQKELLECHEQGNEVIVKGRIIYNEFSADAKNVIGAFNRREKFIQLSDNTVGLLPRYEGSPWETLAIEGEFEESGIKMTRYSAPSLISNVQANTHVTLTLEESLKKLFEKLNKEGTLNEIIPAENFKGQLRAYQQQGVNWLSFLHANNLHGLLADDMGLGKTVQVLAFISKLHTSDPILIVAPTSLLFNWKKEFENFLPDQAIYLHLGKDRIKTSEHLKSQKIILTSYSTLKLDIQFFLPFLFECIILDEAQTIKNAQTQISQAIFTLKSKFRLSLTGTPLENRIEELWSQFRFLIPDLFDNLETFKAQANAAFYDQRYLQQIKRKVRPFMLRRTKKEVAKDLPDKIEQIVYVELDEEQRKVYEDFLSRSRIALKNKIAQDGAAKHRMEILETILRLRQICCHPLLAAKQLSEEEAYCNSAKVEAVINDLEIAIEEGRKVLLFSQFTGMLQLLSKEMQKREWSFCYLDGQSKDREKQVEQFQSNPAIPIFLISLKAGGVGLNLTAADYVFLFDPWWNEAVENQAIDRAHRIGQTETVIAKRYIAIDTIEEKILKLKEHKRNLVDTLIDEELSTNVISVEDLLDLIE